MITQQVVNYIKEQLSRGVTREKIRSNLLSAGWLEEDITQAFTFSEPNLPNATLKIAPSFAVENEIVKEIPVDKTSILKQDTEYVPILKKDSSSLDNSINSVEVRPVAPIENTPLASNVNPLENINNRVLPEIKKEENISSVPNTNFTSGTIQQTVMSPAVNSMTSSLNNSIQVDTVRTLNSNVALPIKKTSGFLKFIAILLLFILIVGNLYLWLFVAPSMNKNLPQENNQLNQSQETSQVVREVDLVQDLDNVDNTNVLPIDSTSSDLIIPSSQIQSSAASFFTKYNSYGGIAMPMGSCNASGTVFVDPIVQSSLDKLSTLTGRVPQCSLIADSNPSLKDTRTVGYLIYIPMESGGYCIDNTGASIKVASIPTGDTCVSGS